MALHENTFMNVLYTGSQHMELAEWLVRGVPELVSRVRRPGRSSSMMHIIYSYKNPSCNCVIVWLKKKNTYR